MDTESECVKKEREREAEAESKGQKKDVSLVSVHRHQPAPYRLDRMTYHPQEFNQESNHVSVNDLNDCKNDDNDNDDDYGPAFNASLLSILSPVSF